jgi:hypothetical protein
MPTRVDRNAKIRETLTLFFIQYVIECARIFSLSEGTLALSNESLFPPLRGASHDPTADPELPALADGL